MLSKTIFYKAIDDDVELQMLHELHARELFDLTENNRAYLREWLPWVDPTQSPEDCRRFIRAALDQYDKNQGVHAGIWYKGALVGAIGFRPIDWANRSSEIGYWLAAKHQGKGIVTRSCRTLVEYAFFELGLHRIMIRCAEGNIKSRAIPERLGFRYEGTQRQAEFLNDHYVDLRTYGLLARDVSTS